MPDLPAPTDRNVIRIMCPKLSCQRILAVPANARGKLVRCKGCGANIRIPAKKAAIESAPIAAPKEAGEAASPEKD